MNWDAIAAFAELTAAVGVIVSLLYLAFQLKQSSKSARAAASSELMMSAATFTSNMYMYPDTGSLFLRGLSDPDELDEAEWTRVSFMLEHLLRGQEVMQLQYLDGLVSREYWETAEANINRFCASPGFKKYWEMQSMTYTISFQELIDKKQMELHIT
jgi:hypothetical protein